MSGNTILLVHFDNNLPGGYGGSPLFYDEGLAGTQAENYNSSHWISNTISPVFDSVNYKFGGGWLSLNGASNVSMYWDGSAATTNYLTNVNGTSGNFTFEGWVRISTSDFFYRCIFHIFDNNSGGNKTTGPVLGLLNRELWFAQGGQAASLTGHSLTLNTWHAVAVSRSGSTTRVYLDGNLIFTANSLDYGINKNAVFIGQYAAGGLGAPENFAGLVDEFRFSNVALYTGASYQVQNSQFANYAPVQVVTEFNDFADNNFIQRNIPYTASNYYTTGVVSYHSIPEEEVAFRVWVAGFRF